MEDINYVTGFTEPEFDTYTFGPDPGDYANKKVNYYFPSEEKDEEEVENDYWKKAKTESEVQQFQNNWYYYYQDGDSMLYGYSGGNDLDATSLIKNPDRFKYIIGEDGSYEYLVASHSTKVFSGGAYFEVTCVGDSEVNVDYNPLCGGFDDRGLTMPGGGLHGIRPIVVLPSDIEVEENASGQWDIAY